MSPARVPKRRSRSTKAMPNRFAISTPTVLLPAPPGPINVNETFWAADGNAILLRPIRKNGSILPERTDRVDPSGAQRGNERRTGARGDDNEQACGVGDRIEETYARSDVVCRRCRQEHGAERDREAAAKEQTDADGTR